jgi:DNA-binding CsgD family transcriptional regulator
VGKEREDKQRSARRPVDCSATVNSKDSMIAGGSPLTRPGQEEEIAPAHHPVGPGSGGCKHSSSAQLPNEPIVRSWSRVSPSVLRGVRGVRPSSARTTWVGMPSTNGRSGDGLSACFQRSDHSVRGPGPVRSVHRDSRPRTTQTGGKRGISRHARLCRDVFRCPCSSCLSAVDEALPAAEAMAACGSSSRAFDRRYSCESRKSVGLSARREFTSFTLHRPGCRRCEHRGRAETEFPLTEASKQHGPLRRPSTLTKAQGAIIVLIAEGRTDKEIAYKVGMSYRTVRTHLERLYVLNEVHCKAALVARLAQRYALSEHTREPRNPNTTTVESVAASPESPPARGDAGAAGPHQRPSESHAAPLRGAGVDRGTRSNALPRPVQSGRREPR